MRRRVEHRYPAVSSAHVVDGFVVLVARACKAQSGRSIVNALAILSARVAHAAVDVLKRA